MKAGNCGGENGKMKLYFLQRTELADRVVSAFRAAEVGEYCRRNNRPTLTAMAGDQAIVARMKLNARG